jgi:hypothetical protein
MYAKPTLRPLDVDVAIAICCHVYVNDMYVVRQTPLCVTPICEDPSFCTVVIGGSGA